MRSQKIVILGGGSLGFTPYLVQDFILSGFTDSQIGLVDLDRDALDLRTRFTRLIAQHLDSQVQITSTVDRRRALPEADFVICTIGVSSQTLLQTEIDLCRKYGILHTTGDTVDPAGLSRALRTVPVLMEIGRDMEKLCPQAWLINYTNPMSACCLGVNQHTSVRVVGLCHGTLGTAGRLAQALEVDASRLFVQAAGVNHLVWFQTLQLDGAEDYPRLRDPAVAAKLKSSQPASYRLLEIYGLYPSPGDRHIAEFYPFYLRKGTGQFRKYGFTLRDYKAIYRNKAQTRQGILDRAAGRVSLEDLTQFSGEAASHLMRALCGEEERVYDVNVLNRGYLPDLPDGCVVELPAVVNSAGIHGLRRPALPPAIASHLHRHGRSSSSPSRRPSPVRGNSPGKPCWRIPCRWTWMPPSNYWTN